MLQFPKQWQPIPNNIGIGLPLLWEFEYEEWDRLQYKQGGQLIYHLCLGSNLQDPAKQLDKAISAIENEPDIAVLKRSSRIKTTPYGNLEQPDFYNQVLEVESCLPPGELLQKLLAIETYLGRTREVKWGPRVIDIDILLAENTVINTAKDNADNALPQLTLPHPDFHNRLFALQLLTELVPEAVHPTMHKTISELYYSLINRGGKP